MFQYQVSYTLDGQDTMYLQAEVAKESVGKGAEVLRHHGNHDDQGAWSELHVIVTVAAVPPTSGPVTLWRGYNHIIVT